MEEFYIKGPILATRNLSHREVAGVLLWAAVMILFASLPYVVAELWSGPDRYFSGFIWGVDEGNVYLSWIRQHSEGSWVAANQFTTHPQNPRFFNIFLFVLGTIARVLRLSPLQAFHLARLLGIPCALYAFYCLVAHVTAIHSVRVFSLLFASLASGFGWIFTLLAYAGRQVPVYPMDCAASWQAMPEAVTFLSFLLNPLFTWSVGLMCLVLLWAWRALERGSLKAATLAGLLLLVLGNIHTYDVFAVHAAILLWAAVLVLRRNTGLARAVGLYGVMWLIGAPSLLWAWYVSGADPSYLTKISTPTLSPRPVDYAAGYGLLGLAAVLGMLTAWVLRPRHPRSLAMVGWAMATLVLVYAPVSFQRKMAEGLHLSLSYLAALALGVALPWLVERRPSRLFSPNQRLARRRRLTLIGGTVFVLLSLPSNVVFVYDSMQHVAVNYADLRHVLMPPVYLTVDEVRGLQWLARHAQSGDVVMSSSLIGNHLPAWCRAKVVVGHWAETLDFPRAVRQVATFYAPGLLPQARASILHNVGATYVWWGQYERLIQRSMLAVAQEAVGGPVPFPDSPARDLPTLRPVFVSGDVIIYRVTH